MNATEQHRFRCEVRHLLKLRLNEGKGAAADYLQAARSKRGESGARKLHEATNTQWRAGNRGNPGEWR